VKRRFSSGLRPRRALTPSAALLALYAISALALADTAAPPGTLTADQRAIIEQIAKPSRAENILYAGAPADPIGIEVKLPFRDGKSLALVRTRTSVLRDGSVAWIGEVEETGERALLMLWSNALLSGYFAYKGTLYTVESLGGGVHAFAELNSNKLPGDHPPAAARDSVPLPSNPEEAAAPRPAPAEPAVAPFADADRQALEAKSMTIDVMILYSSNAGKYYIRDPADLLALAIEETNETFRRSGLGNIKLRLVHSQGIEYDGKTDDQFTHLYTMVDGLGPFKDVKKLRDEKRADIVGLIIDNPKGCGLSTRVGPESDEAFFVVHHACASITMSIAHEIGHILGVRHDRFMDESNAPFAYGHGYVNGTKWRDIMSYRESCNGCQRVPVWSSPDVIIRGEAAGTADYQNNARVIAEEAARVAAFR
jgi:hypothetical protein